MLTKQKTHSISDIDLQFVYQHLQLESKYLDFVIDCSEQLRAHLNPNSSGTTEPNQSGEKKVAVPTVDVQELDRKIAELRVDSVEPFSSLAEGRLKLTAILKLAFPESQRPPSLRDLIRLTEEPMRAKLKNLRIETRAKLNRIHTVNTGTQAVLAYTMNYYEKLLNGISGTEISSQRYSSSGEMSPHMPGIIRTNC